jgi:hypothetical protein
MLSILTDTRGIKPDSEVLSRVDRSVHGFFRFISLESNPIATIPGAKFFMKNREKEAYALRDSRETYYQSIIDDYKRRRERGETGECIVGSLIDKQEETGMTDLQV